MVSVRPAPITAPPSIRKLSETCFFVLCYCESVGFSLILLLLGDINEILVFQSPLFCGRYYISNGANYRCYLMIPFHILFEDVIL